MYFKKNSLKVSVLKSGCSVSQAQIEITLTCPVCNYEDKLEPGGHYFPLSWPPSVVMNSILDNIHLRSNGYCKGCGVMQRLAENSKVEITQELSDKLSVSKIEQAEKKLSSPQVIEI